MLSMLSLNNINVCNDCVYALWRCNMEQIANLDTIQTSFLSWITFPFALWQTNSILETCNCKDNFDASIRWNYKEMSKRWGCFTSKFKLKSCCDPTCILARVTKQKTRCKDIENCYFFCIWIWNTSKYFRVALNVFTNKSKQESYSKQLEKTYIIYYI